MARRSADKMAKAMELTAERLRELLSYDPLTGTFAWRITWYGHVPGSPAGHLMSIGYWTISLDGVAYYAHRLAWLYTYGVWPKRQIDHLDMNRANNSLKNLREATKSQNMFHRGRQKNNTTGFTGIYLHKPSGRYWAWHKRDGRVFSVGYFGTIEQAVSARNRAIEYRGEFAYLGAVEESHGAPR